MIKPLISIAVCTYNREDVIADCLLSMAAQEADQSLFEVIIVNNNSTDRTSEIAKQIVDQHPNFRIVLETEVGLSAARNRGYREAQADYVAYIDDDAKLSPKWVTEALKIMSEIKPDIFGGPIYPFYKSEKADWYKDEYGNYSVYDFQGFVKLGSGIFLSGSNVVFSTQVLEEYGGFDTKFGMKGKQTGYHEETAIQVQAQKDNKLIYYSLDLVVYHLVSYLKQNIIFHLYAGYKSGKDGLGVWNRKYTFNELVSLANHLDYVFGEFKYAMVARDMEKYPHPENYVVENLYQGIEEIGRRAGYFSNPENLDLVEVLTYFKQYRKANMPDVLAAQRLVYSQNVNTRQALQLLRYALSQLTIPNAWRDLKKSIHLLKHKVRR